MIYTTLPLASTRSPYEHLTIRNTSSTEPLTVQPNGTDIIEGVWAGLVLYPQSAVTLQTDGVTNWARIQDFKLPVSIQEAELASDWGFGATWTAIPGMTITNDRASGIYMGTGYFPVDVSAGNNVNVGFAVRALLDGVPFGPVLEDWQDRASSVRLDIVAAVPVEFELGETIHFEAQTTGAGTYLMLGTQGAAKYTAFELTGPL